MKFHLKYQNLCVLIIEDNDEEARILYDRIKDLGFKCISIAKSIEEGKKIARDLHPHLILLDLVFNSKYKGLNFIGWYRKINPFAKIIVITGFPSFATVHRALNLGVDDYITKPFVFKEITKSIDSVLVKFHDERLKYYESILSIFDVNKFVSYPRQMRNINSILYNLLEPIFLDYGEFIFVNPETQSLKSLFIFPNVSDGGCFDFDEVKAIKKTTFLKLPHNKIMRYKIERGECFIIPVRLIGKRISAYFIGYREVKFTMLERSYLKKIAKYFLTLDYLAYFLHKTKKEKAHIEYDLSKTKERYEDLTRQQEEFITAISHEMRSPLTSILGYSELLMTKDYNERTVKEIARIIYSESVHLLGIVKNLLQYSRYQRNKIQVVPEEFTAQDLIDIIFQHYQIQQEGHRIRYNIYIKEDTKFYQAKDLLIQVITNLIDNALKYSPEDMEVIVTYFEKGDKFFVFVKDYGIGIPEFEQKRIFNKFFRSSNARSSNLEGTGLGLTIVKILLELIKGRIYFYSRQNYGSIFWIEVKKKLG